VYFYSHRAHSANPLIFFFHCDKKYELWGFLDGISIALSHLDVNNEHYENEFRMIHAKFGVLWLGVLAGLLWGDIVVVAAETPQGPSDWGLATVVVGKDRALELEQKLGASPCLVPSVSGESVSYLYNVGGAKGSSFLRFEVNGHVDAITISKDPPLAGVCYAPAPLAVSLATSKGLQLGATVEEVTRLYGNPTDRFSVGPLMRFRYVAVYDRSYEWDLVFRNGRLVEWTVSTEE
jgi:hypothetical protein